MKTRTFSIFVAIFSICSFCSTALIAQNIEPFIIVSKFSNEGNPYLEFTIVIKGNSVVYTQGEKGFVATIKVNANTLQNGSTINKQIFYIISESFSDGNTISKPDIFYSTQVEISNGKYNIEFTLQDIISKEEPYFQREYVSVNFPPNQLTISSIDMFQSFSKFGNPNDLEKYGFFYLPLFEHFAPASMAKLPYSFEVYNADKSFGNGKSIFINSYIEEFENHKIALPSLQKVLMFNASPMVICTDEYDISNLPSGKYNLVVKVSEKESSEMKIRKQFFVRENSSTSVAIENFEKGDGATSFAGKFPLETLKTNILSISPISNKMEREFIANNINSLSLKVLQNYFYQFWVSLFPSSPEQAWNDYYSNVQIVNNQFSSNQNKGFATERGRVYLQYGAPTSIAEIEGIDGEKCVEWSYLALGGEENAHFVFCKSEVGQIDYQLVHSTLYGEAKNRDWQKLLKK